MTVTAALDALRRDLSGRADLTASVAVTVAGEEVYTAAFGYASRTWSVPATIGTRYDTASITKLFTTVAALRQVEAGAFDLDEPVIAYLGLAGTAIGADVTARHLLTHTSGIADDADEEAGEEWSDLFRDNPTYKFTELVHHLPHFADKPANFAPGTRVRYCNAGFQLLGMMVEKATGVRYRDHVPDAVFAPAGMVASGFFRMDETVPDVAEAVEPDADSVTGWRRNIFAYPPVGDAAGGAYCTVGDLLAFHRAAAGGALLGERFTREMWTPRATRDDDPTHHVGYGAEMRTGADGTVVSRWKEGISDGTSGMLRHYPREDVTIAILAVGADTVWDPVRVFDRAMLGAPTA